MTLTLKNVARLFGSDCIAARYVSSKTLLLRSMVELSMSGIPCADSVSLSLSLSLCLCACVLCCISSSILLFYSGFVYRRRRRYSCRNAAHRRSLNCRAARPSPGLLRSRYRCALYAVNRGHRVINYSAVDHQPYLTRPRPPR